MWCADLGLRALLIEREPELGGQLVWTFGAIENYLGVRAASGLEMRDRFTDQIANRHIEIQTSARISRIDLGGLTVELADQSWSCRSLILATGVRRRTLGVEGEQRFQNKGILRSGTESQFAVSGKSVVIVGGGDAALENALILSKTARQITIVHRGGEFSARREFVDAATAQSNVAVMLGSRVTHIGGGERLETVTVMRGNEAETLKTDALLIRIGVQPNTEMVSRSLALDSGGYIVTDRNGKTSIPDVFGIGDAANRISQTISTAVGEGSAVAKYIAQNLVQI